MKGRMDVYFDNALKENVFPKDFINEHTKMPIGKSFEQSLNQQLYSRYQRTLNSFSENLSISECSEKTSMMLFYPTEYYFCTCSPHRKQEQAVLLFGTRYTGGHAFAICADCFLKLMLILLRHYKYNKVYQYRNRKNFISLNNAKYDCICYLCKDSGSKHYILEFNKRRIVLCESCLNDFTDLILTSPTAKSMFPLLAEQYIQQRELNK